ncbi:MAG: proline dehydrogenase family protein [Cyclobacteriaceae bacterium]|nr:proline dehydrogenase family protein [Cyclobacteriaceae bacterium]
MNTILAHSFLPMESTPTISFEDTAVAFAHMSDAELKKANFIFSIVNHPSISSMAIALVKTGMSIRLPIEGLIRKTVFDHFCAGISIDDAEQSVKALDRFHVRAILDYSVEGEISEDGFEETTRETLRTIEKAKVSTNLPFCVFKPTGLGSAELLEKIQSKQELSQGERAAYERIKSRFDRICAKGHEYNIPILVDAEDSWYQQTIDRMVVDLMIKYNREKAIVFNTYQLYRTEGLGNLNSHFHEAVMNNVFFGAKLVRGAYMEKERERAEKFGYPSPIHPNKETTDDAFNKALTFCINNNQRISVMCGSHNEHSNYYLTILMEKHNIRKDDNRVWFAQLYGMSDNISFNLAKAGYNVVKYLPYGPIRSVMPYLFRRAEENTSVAGQSSRELTLIQKELKRRGKS